MTFAIASGDRQAATRREPSSSATTSIGRVQGRSSPSRRIVFLSIQPFEADFRRHLIECLRDLGCACVHLARGSSFIATRLDTGRSVRQEIGGIEAALRYLRDFAGQEQLILIDVMAAQSVIPMIRLRHALRAHTWLYDVFDDFTYGSAGLERMKRRLG